MMRPEIHPLKTDRNFIYVGFDGSLHSFTSGWQGADRIVDPPVPGAIPVLIALTKDHEVVVVSHRLFYPFGLTAMHSWIRDQCSRQLKDLGVGEAGLVYVMSHIHLCRPPLRSQKMDGDRIGMMAVEFQRDFYVDRAVVGEGTHLWVPVDPPGEPGGDSQHI